MDVDIFQDEGEMRWEIFSKILITKSYTKNLWKSLTFLDVVVRNPIPTLPIQQKPSKTNRIGLDELLRHYIKRDEEKRQKNNQTLPRMCSIYIDGIEELRLLHTLNTNNQKEEWKCWLVYSPRWQNSMTDKHTCSVYVPNISMDIMLIFTYIIVLFFYILWFVITHFYCYN